MLHWTVTVAFSRRWKRNASTPGHAVPRLMVMSRPPRISGVLVAPEFAAAVNAFGVLLNDTNACSVGWLLFTVTRYFGSTMRRTAKRCTWVSPPLPCCHAALWAALRRLCQSAGSAAVRLSQSWFQMASNHAALFS